ncbi:hypothetical protein HAX54_049952 [Datura stramonium]|uniref:Uncharacterized protein n=1 Tax=Datura stramonium TaxID=4076 RepID=A0ABS8WPP9_DATST|nr:hypothetical protein [Datura stramonium]
MLIRCGDVLVPGPGVGKMPEIDVVSWKFNDLRRLICMEAWASGLCYRCLFSHGDGGCYFMELVISVLCKSGCEDTATSLFLFDELANIHERDEFTLVIGSCGCSKLPWSLEKAINGELQNHLVFIMNYLSRWSTGSNNISPALLLACGPMVGLLMKALAIFSSMEAEYGVRPGIEQLLVLWAS